jgi:hypothetical protein
MLALFAAAAWAATGGQTYGTSLLERELGRHRQLSYASIDLEAPAPGHFEAGEEKRAASKIKIPVTDGLGEPIGTLDLGSARAVGPRVAAQIAYDIARHVYSKSVLGEADPFTPAAFRSTSGERLIEKELEREPALVTIAFHVALPGKANQIIASNFGRIGKAADGDDQRVIATSNVLQELTNGGKRLAVELPLLDSSRRTIGALSTSFMIGPDGRAGAYRAALRVQHDVARSVPGLESLAR